MDKMSHWNYRMVWHKAGQLEENPDLKWDDYLAMHEVHYNDAGEIENMTKNPVTVMGDEGKDSLNSIRWVLEKMEEATHKPVIDFDTLKEIKGEADDNSKSSKTKE